MLSASQEGRQTVKVQAYVGQLGALLHIRILVDRCTTSFTKRSIPKQNDITPPSKKVESALIKVLRGHKATPVKLLSAFPHVVTRHTSAFPHICRFWMFLTIVTIRVVSRMGLVSGFSASLFGFEAVARMKRCQNTHPLHVVCRHSRLFDHPQATCLLIITSLPNPSTCNIYYHVVHLNRSIVPRNVYNMGY